MRTTVNVSAALTIDPTHSGCDLLCSGGQFAITLPAPIANCDVRIVNGDSANGKILSGFPADANPKLYPKQAIAINSDGSSWFVEDKPGRWKIPLGTILYVNNGPRYPMGSDANDGLTPSTALLHMSAAASVIQTDFDCSQSVPTAAPCAGSTFVDDTFSVSGQPVGSNLVRLSPYGTGALTWTCQWACITVGDNGELNAAWNALSTTCAVTLAGNTLNAASMGTILQHNNGLLDWQGDCTIVGAGANSSAFFFDGPTPGSAMVNGFKVTGVFGDIWHMDEGGGRFTLSGPIQPVGACSAARLYGIYGTNELILGGPAVLGGYTSLGPSQVGGNALLVTNGVGIPGGVTLVGGGRVAMSKTT